MIDKGVCVIIPVVGLHRDPAYFENPDEYNPENFSENNKSSRHHCTYLPFGEGPRVCIGKKTNNNAFIYFINEFKFFRLTIFFELLLML